MLKIERERDNMEKTILVVEITKYSSGRKTYTIKKHANTLDKASEYLVSLQNLNEDTDISYELFNRFGQLDVDKSERVEKNEKQLELPFEKGKKDREDQLKEWANKFWI